MESKNIIYTWKSSQMTVEELFNSKLNYVFLVGAGISYDKPSCLPTGKAITEEILKYIAPEKEFNKIIKLSNPDPTEMQSKGDYLRFEQLIELLQELDPTFEILNYLAECNRPNFTHYLLAELNKKGCPIFTTNFDSLLEYALVKRGIPKNQIKPVILEQDWKSISSPQYGIFKLHGSFENIVTRTKTSESLQTTLKQITQSKGDSFRIEAYKYNVFEKYLKEYPLIVMGYSGNDDFDVIPTLLSIESSQKIIWINHDAHRTLKDVLIEEVHQEAKVKEQSIEKTGEVISEKSGMQLLDFPVRDTRVAPQIFRVSIQTNELCQVLWNRFCSRANPVKLDETPVQVPSIKKYIEKKLNLGEDEKYRLTGEIYFKRSKFSEAESCFTTIYQNARKAKDPKKQSDALIYLSNVKNIIGEPEKALEYLLEAKTIKMQQQDQDALIIILNNLAMQYYLKGNFGQALNLYSQIENNPKFAQTPSYLINYGNALVSSGQLMKALTCFEKAVDQADKQGLIEIKAFGLLSLGLLYVHTEELDKALKAYENANHLFQLIGDLKGCIDVFIRIGSIYEGLGNFSFAAEQYKKGYDLSRRLGIKPKMAELSVNLATIQVSDGNFETAEIYFEDARLIFESINNLLGTILYQIKYSGLLEKRLKFNEAIVLLYKAIENANSLDSINLKILAYQQLLQIHGLLNQFKEMQEDAEQIYNLVIRIGDNKLIQNNLQKIILFLQMFQQTEEATKYQTKLTEVEKMLGEESLLALLSHASILETQGLYEAANKTLETAGKRGDLFWNATIISRMGSNFMKLNDYEKAIEYFGRAVETARKGYFLPELAFSLMHLGKAYKLKAELNLALQSYTEALEVVENLKLYTTIQYCSFFIGDVLEEMGNITEALKYYKHALEVSQSTKDPLNQIEYLRVCGRVEEKSKHFQEALSYYQESLKIAMRYEAQQKLPILQLHTTIAHIFMKIQNFTESNKEYLITLELLQQYGKELLSSIEIADIYMFLAGNYTELKEYELANKYAILSAEEYHKIDNKFMEKQNYSMVLYNYGFLAEGLIQKQQYEEAKIYSQKALECYEKYSLKIADKIYILTLLYAIAEKQNQINQAIVYIKEGIESLRKYLSQNPQDYEAMSDLATFLCRLASSKIKTAEYNGLKNIIDEGVTLCDSILNKTQSGLDKRYDDSISNWKITTLLQGVFLGFYTKDLDLMIIYVNKVHPLIETSHSYSPQNIANILKGTANLAIEKHQHDIAKEYYQKAIVYWQKINKWDEADFCFIKSLPEDDLRVISNTKLSEIRTFLDAKEYDKMYPLVISVINDLSQLPPSRDLGIAYNQLGIYFWAKKSFHDSLESFEKAIDISRKTNNPDEAITSLDNLCKLLERHYGDMEKLINTQKIKLEICGDYPVFYKDKADTLVIIGQLYHKLGNITEGNKFYEEAAIFCEEKIKDSDMAKKARESKK